MSEASSGVKSKVLEKNEKSSSGSPSNAVPENPRPNMKETTSATETKVKASERKNSPKRMARNPNARLGRDRPRREDDRRSGINSGTGRSGRRTDTSFPRSGSAVSHGGGGSYSGSPSPQPGSRDGHSSMLDKKVQDPGKAFLDESKLSKLIRRLFSTAERERRLSSARTLKDFLLTQEGTKACLKGAHDILGTLQSIFYERGFKEIKIEVAGCIGYIGSIMGQEMHSYFDWLFAQASSTMIDDDIKISYLQALLETLKYDDKKQNAADMMTKVMANIQNLLESADNPDLLVAVVDVILFIARIYPHIFSAHFRNTVDILVGWHIDPSQRESLIHYMSQALVSFKQFWSSDINFSMTLLTQFLEDMEAYAEDLNISATGQNAGEDKLPTPEEYTVKMGALLRVFTTVVESLGENLSPAKSGKIPKEFSCKLLEKIIQSIEAAMKYVFIESVLVAANNCICMLLGQLGLEAMSCAESLLPYVSMQAFYNRLSSKPLLLAFFALVHKVVGAFSTQLPVDFLTHLLEADSLLMTTKLSHSSEVLNQLMALYHAVMGLKSVPLLEESYRLVLADLEIGFKTLLPPERSRPELVQDNPFLNVHYSAKQAETVILFDLCTLTEIANTKSNLIGMWALSPSIFDLLTEQLEPADSWLAECHPFVQYAIMHTLYGHCCRHGHFISSSNLLTSASSETVSSLATMSHATSGHLLRVLKLLVLLLEEPKTSFDVQCLAIKWVAEIVNGLLSSPHVFLERPCLAMVKAIIAKGFDYEQQIITASALCLQTLYKAGVQFPLPVTRECLELCAFRLSDTRKAIRELFFSLFKVLPLDVITSNTMAFESEEEALARQRKDRSVGLKIAWLARRNHLTFPPLGLFHSHNYRHVISYMLSNVTPSQFGGLHWLEAMFFNCQRSNKEAERSQDSIVLSDLDATESLLWFWASYEAAHLTVLSRLRTLLGKPQETFTTIESVIKTFAAEAKNSSDIEDLGGAGDTIKNEKSGEFTSLQRVHVLLQFMEHLERLLYNAYEGCAVAMAAPQKVVRTFFRTNRNTCLEWLARIRMCVMTVAAHAGMPAVVVRHAHELLSDLADMDNTQGAEFEQGVMHLVKALCDLHCPEAVLGLYNWCRQVAGKKFSWVKAAAEKANRRYEQAAKEYQSVLKSILAIDDASESKDSSESSEASPEHRAPQKTDTELGRQRSVLTKHCKPNPSTVAFISNEVMESYLKLSDWDSVMKWQESLTEWRSESGLTSQLLAVNSTLDINYIKAMSHFDCGDIDQVRSSLELVPGASINESAKGDHFGMRSWNPQTELCVMHKQFLRAATLLQEQRQTNHRAEVVRFLNQAERIGEGLLRMAALEWPPTLPSELVTELTIVSTLRKHLEDRKSKFHFLPLSSRLCPQEDQDLAMYLQAIRLVTLQLHLPCLEQKIELTTQLSSLQIATATLARKQNNFGLAEDLLVRQIALLSAPISQDHPPSIQDLPSLISLLRVQDSVQLLDVMRVERECSKLLHSLNLPFDALEVISNSVSTYLGITMKTPQENGTIVKTRELCSELCSRSLLTLVKWLQADIKLMAGIGCSDSASSRQGIDNHKQGETILRNMKILLDSESRWVAQQPGLLLDGKDGLEGSWAVSEGETVMGRLLHLATLESPTLAKSWFMLAGWCYKWGRKTVDSASHGSVELSAEEKSLVLSMMPKGTSIEETQRIMGILSQIHDLGTSEEDISDQDQSLYDDGTETTRKQLLMSSESLRIANDGCVDQLLDVWRGVVKRVYHLYQLSAKAYFIFLQLNDLTKGEESEDGNIIATLRLLRLLVKHAWELQGVLETGLAHTPTAPWKGIIPQLFARLSHPENYVRRSVSELLCRVAQDAPHLIVYPAIVGSTSGKVDNKVTEESRFLNTYLSQEESETDGLDTEDQGSQDDEDDENMSDDSTNTMLQSCLAAIVDTLSQHNPRMISEVQGMVVELRRITLLWEELWLGTLSQHHADVQRRLNQLEAEIRKVNTNAGLPRQDKAAIIREKHHTILKPTLYTMERLHAITSQPPETPREVWFQNTYGEMIKNALDRLRNPPNPSHPQNSWNLFKQLYISLQQRAQKRGSLHLRMDEISPRLATLSKSLIPMPGLGLTGQAVTIEKVCNTVQILPTKTKPKKMIFIGSDGKRHPYLFKGLEDLHLDERIMQFLSIVNNMFMCANKGHGSKMQYRARHYSVTPLGPRSGLIQWVEGATPLFGLYKKWQQREAYAQTLKPTNTVSQQSVLNPQTIPRPSEVYYSKLAPALKEKGIETTDNRKEWPIAILRKVLEDLMDDTPDDLLAKELWCASASAGEWWQMIQTYSRSTAVMSMIGYIIGLGDRHLDNVLVDLATGEVVHIDYNVCFEKGKNLRVPERVPFRMTQNIEIALGLTGVEGIFRLSSEHVLRTMRKGRETLLTLLEAFVYDPLVDWTTGNEGGYTGAFYGGETAGLGVGEAGRSKKEMEREITVSMFAIRCAEMKSAWSKNKDEILQALPELQVCVSHWMVAREDVQGGQQALDSLRAIQALLANAASDPSHALHSLGDRYTDYAVVKATKDEVVLAVEEKIGEFAHWQQVHQTVIESIQGGTFQKLCAEISKPLENRPPSFATATDFLQGAGQSQTVTQCEQLEGEMLMQMKQRRTLLHSTLDILHSYSSIVSQFGVIFANNNRAFNFLTFLRELIADFSSAKCEELTSNYRDLYSPQISQSAQCQLVVSTESRLQNIIAESNARLMKLLERRGQDGASTAMHEMSLHESETFIHSFLQEIGQTGEKSLMCYIVSALSSLCKRYLLMETASAGAGERLMDLTSRDGDWFLDELCSISGNINHFLDTLERNTKAIEIENFKEMHCALQATFDVYVAIQDLNLNFRSIILPEALKLIQSQEPSILSALCQLENLIGESTMSLENMMTQLEMLHRNVIMGVVQGDSNQLMEKIRQIQISFSQLLQGQKSGSATQLIEIQPGELSPGRMLMMCFDGLFTRVDAEFNQLLLCVAQLDIPESWKKVDAVREARSLQLSPWSPETRNLLSTLFFLKRLQAMQDFFQMATQLAGAMQGLSGGVVHDDEQMAKPVKKFIAEFVRKQMIGFPSQLLGCVICVLVETLGVSVDSEVALKDIGAQAKVPLEDLCKKAVETSLRAGHFQHTHLMQATTLTSSQDLCWRKLDLAKRLDVGLSLMKAGFQRWQTQLACFQWLHVDALSSANRTHAALPPPSRAALMLDMKKMVSSLLSQESVIATCNERYTALEGIVIQRLRWAAGANPSLNVTLQHFQEASLARGQLMEEESRLVAEVANLCQGILHFEAWRTRTHDAISTDNSFISLLNRCLECCLMLESTSTSVSEQELQLLSIKSVLPGEHIDAVWLQTVSEHINASIDEATTNISRQQLELDRCKAKILERVSNIRTVLSIHHKLISDVRSILKTMSKLEEQDYGEDINPGGIREYLALYRIFSENITSVLKTVVSDDASQASMMDSETVLHELVLQIPSIYDRLLQFAPPLLQGRDVDDAGQQEFTHVLKRREDVSGSPGRKLSLMSRDQGVNPSLNSPQTGAQHREKSTKKEKISRDPRTGKAIQERNSYAVGVWRRVKMKLDGRDPDSSKRLSVAEQVDYVIKEARDLDNLAVLYEGWTPWV